MEENVVFTCPSTYTNKIAVIKSIRILTGIGLKEAKDASERPGVQQVFPCSLINGSQNPEYDEQVRILQSQGVEVGSPAAKILQELRKLGAQALTQGEDELANEILQLVLAEKLRKGVRLGTE